MKYSNGKKIKVGDKVLIDSKYHGVIVANIEDDEYSDIHTKEQWGYLKNGVIIDTDFGGLVHYKGQEHIDDEEIVLAPNE